MAHPTGDSSAAIRRGGGWLASAFCCIGAWVVCACSAPERTPAEAMALARAPQECPALDGATGAEIAWDEVVRRVCAADAVFLGETHDDAVAHRAQHELVRAFLAAHPRAVLGLEMLERDEQGSLDAYLAGTTDLDAFVDATGSRHWAGRNSWVPWYQPAVDAARQTGHGVIAANAPRAAVSRARREGTDALRDLPEGERQHFEIDEAISRDGDWERLRTLMVEMRGDDGPPTDAEVDAIHRAQRMWDLTMATSLARAWNAGMPFIHLVGGFHVQQRLGTAAIVARLCPTARILVVQLDPSEDSPPDASRRAGADIIVMTVAPVRTQNPQDQDQ